MAKVTVVFTRPSKEYKQQDADSLIRDLDGLIEKADRIKELKELKLQIK